MAEVSTISPTNVLTLEQKILLRQSQMEEVRNPYETGMWEDIGRFIHTRRKDITLNSASN